MDLLLELLQSFGEYPLLSAQSEALAARFEAEFGKLKFEVEEGDAAADSLNFIFVLVSLRVSSIELLLLIGWMAILNHCVGDIDITAIVLEYADKDGKERSKGTL